MALRAVRQENYSGCFIAAIATLMGKTYQQVFSTFYPQDDPLIKINHGFQGVSVERAAFRALKHVGIRGHVSKLKSFSPYLKKNKHALLIIRWNILPTLCHTLVFDGENRSFINPSNGMRIKNRFTLDSFERQLDFGIIIDQIPKSEE